MNYYNICCLLIFLFDWGGDRVYSQAHEQETREENDGTGVADHYTNEVFMKLTEPKVYNKLVPPDGQRPIHANVSLFLLRYGSIEVQKSEFSLNLLVRISWDDSRLYQNKTLNNILEGGFWHFERLWRPSFHVPNSKTPNVLQDSQDNPLLVRINSHGRVLVSKRLRLEGKCQINFRLYPLDIKKITIDIESNELSISNLQLHWNNHDPIGKSENFDVESYELIKYNTFEVISNYTHTGSFSRIKAVLYFQCSFDQFLLDIYIPIVLFVVVSWTSFWIEITAAPARVTLGLTVLLTMVTSAKSARDKLPTLPYVHSMEIWILVSIIFVFATVIEFATVNYIYFDEKRSKLKKNKRKKSVARKQRVKIDKNATQSRSKLFWRRFFLLPRKSQKVKFDVEDPERSKLPNCEETAMEIDRLARIVFPVTYFAFNIIYWVVIGVYSNEAKEQME